MQQEMPIADQYAQGPQQAQPLTPEQIEQRERENKERREKQEKVLDELLPFMRKQAEYDSLKLQMLENDVLLGNISINNLPAGLLQLELKVREVQAMGFLGQWSAGQRAAAEQAKKEMEMSQEEKEAREAFDKLTPEEQAKYQEEALRKYQEAQNSTN